MGFRKFSNGISLTRHFKIGSDVRCRMDRGSDALGACRHAPLSADVLLFIQIKIVGFALVGAAHMQGYIESAINADQTRLSLVIAAVFLFG